MEKCDEPKWSSYSLIYVETMTPNPASIYVYTYTHIIYTCFTQCSCFSIYYEVFTIQMSSHITRVHEE
jgi:hypothetical protein